MSILDPLYEFFFTPAKALAAILHDRFGVPIGTDTNPLVVGGGTGGGALATEATLEQIEIDLLNLTVIVSGGGGGGPVTGKYYISTVFDHNSTDPVVIGTLPIGATVVEVSVGVTAPFTAGAYVSVGTDSSHDRWMSTLQNDLTSSALYIVYGSDTMLGADDAKIWLTGIPCAAGSGAVVVRYDL